LLLIQIYIEELLARVDIKNNTRTASDITQLINYVNSYVFPCDKIDGIQRYSRVFIWKCIHV